MRQSRFIIIILVVLSILISSSDHNLTVTKASESYVITDISKITPEMLNENPEIASKLYSILSGETTILTYASDGTAVKAPLGSSVMRNNNVKMEWWYVSDGVRYKARGTSCFAWACALYGKIYDSTHPHSGGANHDVIQPSNRTLSYETLKELKVRDDVPTYVRVGNHSIIILGYSKERIKFVDANGNGAGLVSMRVEVWGEPTGTKVYTDTIELIVQPSSDYIPNAIVEGTTEKTSGSVPVTLLTGSKRLCATAIVAPSDTGTGLVIRGDVIVNNKKLFSFRRRFAVIRVTLMSDDGTYNKTVSKKVGIKNKTGFSTSYEVEIDYDTQPRKYKLTIEVYDNRDRSSRSVSASFEVR